MVPVLLVLNAGSSSLKFQVFEAGDAGDPQRIFRGQFEGLGDAPHFSVRDGHDAGLVDRSWTEPFGHEQALRELTSWLREHRGEYRLAAIGHRVVHGGIRHHGPVLVDDGVLRELEALEPLAPLHQPHNLEPIRIVRSMMPDLPQVACFDTAFHRRQPEVAQLFALPQDMIRMGVRRYGFHGLSYEYIASVLSDYDAALASGRVVVAHLGNGASLCALAKGESVATTMGLSALEGLPMGTRCGSLDAGVVFFMLRELKLSPGEVEQILYKKSGLLGLSGLTNDMRKLRSAAPTNRDARLAIDVFVYRIVREIGSLIAALGGIDGIVFTAGIGEHDVATRSEVLRGLAWAGFELDEAANGEGGPRITRQGAAAAWVIPTNEELSIALGMVSALSDTRRALAV